MTSRREHPVLKDETACGTDWCIAIVQEIIDAERDIRAGEEADTETRGHLRQMTWERLEDLQQGLMTSGIGRPERRD